MQVRDDRCASRWPERGGKALRRQVPVIDIDIDKNGASADRMDAEEVAAIVVSGHHHFVARTDLERSQRQLDRECPAAAGQHMLDAMNLGQSLFQSRNVPALIAAPGAIAVRLMHGFEDGFVREGPIGRSLWSDRFAARELLAGICPHS